MENKVKKYEIKLKTHLLPVYVEAAEMKADSSYGWTSVYDGREVIYQARTEDIFSIRKIN